LTWDETVSGYDPTNWLLVFVRVSAMVAIFPLFSMQNFPVAMRLALATLISFLVSPLLPPLAGVPDESPEQPVRNSPTDATSARH